MEYGVDEVPKSHGEDPVRGRARRRNKKSRGKDKREGSNTSQRSDSTRADHPRDRNKAAKRDSRGKGGNKSGARNGNRTGDAALAKELVATVEMKLGELDAIKEKAEEAISKPKPSGPPPHHEGWDHLLKKMKGFNFCLHQTTHVPAIAVAGALVQITAKSLTIGVIGRSVSKGVGFCARLALGHVGTVVFQALGKLPSAYPLIGALATTAVSLTVGSFIVRGLEKHLLGQNALGVKVVTESFRVLEPEDKTKIDLRPDSIASAALKHEVASCDFVYRRRAVPAWFPDIAVCIPGYCDFKVNLFHEVKLKASYEALAQLQTLKSSSLLSDEQMMFERMHLSLERIQSINFDRFDLRYHNIYHGSMILAYGLYRRRLEDLENVNFPRPKTMAP